MLPNEEERYHLPEESKISSDINTHAFNHYCIEANSLKKAGLIVEEEYETDFTNRVEFFILDIPYI